MTEAEQKVRAAWNVDTTFDSMDGTTIFLGNKRFYTWQAALDFTECRQREIAELKEEIDWVEGFSARTPGLRTASRCQSQTYQPPQLACQAPRLAVRVAI